MGNKTPRILHQRFVTRPATALWRAANHERNNSREASLRPLRIHTEDLSSRTFRRRQRTGLMSWMPRCRETRLGRNEERKFKQSKLLIHSTLRRGLATRCKTRQGEERQSGTNLGSNSRMTPRQPFWGLKFPVMFGTVATAGARRWRACRCLHARWPSTCLQN